MSSQVPNCAKCGKPLSGKVKIVDGKRYHEAHAPAAVSPVEVQAPVKAQTPPPPEEPEADEQFTQAFGPQADPVNEPNGRFVVPAGAKTKDNAVEMRHIAFFQWQGQDGTVFNHTVRGKDFPDFVEEWNAAFEWIIAQGGTFVNTGRQQYAEQPKKHDAPSQPAQGSTPHVPASVSSQTRFFENDGVKYGVGEVKELRVKFLDKSNQYVVSVKVQPFMQYGVTAWKEVAEPIWGDLSKRSLSEPLPITDDKKFVLFSMKDDGKPNKVIEFRATRE